jgi:uncharacterized protein
MSERSIRCCVCAAKYTYVAPTIPMQASVTATIHGLIARAPAMAGDGIASPPGGRRTYHEPMRIASTPAAASVVRRVQDEGRDNLVMVLSNGCCDSTAPYLYDNYLPEPESSPVGDIAGVSVVAPGWLARLYPGEELLTIDVEQGVVEDSFSLETEFDCRFVLRAPVPEPQP